VDDDRDGLVDEDGPNDIDGDGEILQMRKRDPTATGHRRARRPADAAPEDREPGQWRTLARRDRRRRRRLVNEEARRRRPNRNWPVDWRPEPVQGGAGPYPLSEPETRSTALWCSRTRDRRRQSYHNAG